MTGHPDQNINRIRGVRHIRTDRQLTFDDDLVIVSTQDGPVTITLPTAEQFPGQFISIKSNDAGSSGFSVTIVPQPGENIDGMVSMMLSLDEEGCSMQSDGENWRHLAGVGSGGDSMPSGPAGGVLSSMYPNPVLAAFGDGEGVHRPFEVSVSADGRVSAVSATVDEFDVNTTFRANFTTTPIVGHAWTTPILPAGTYEISVQVIWSLDSGAVDFESRVHFDGISVTPFGPYHVEEPKDAAGAGAGGTNQRLPRSYPALYQVVANGGDPHLLELLFNKSGGGGGVEAALHHSVLRIRRVK